MVLFTSTVQKHVDNVIVILSSAREVFRGIVFRYVTIGVILSLNFIHCVCISRIDERWKQNAKHLHYTSEPNVILYFHGGTLDTAGSMELGSGISLWHRISP